MFAVHYFPEHYFARTYFSHLGAAIVANICTLDTLLESSTVAVLLENTELAVALSFTSIDVAITCHAHTIITPTAYHADAVHFDGATTFHIDALNSTANTSFFSMSTFYRVPSRSAGGLDGWYWFVVDTAGIFQSNMFQIANDAPSWPLWLDRSWIDLNGNGGDFAFMPSGSMFNSSYNHLLLSCRSDTGEGKLYINDIDVTASPWAPTAIPFQMNFGGLSLCVFSMAPLDVASSILGDIADFWFAPGINLLDGVGDIPIATRRKFISAAGKPVDLGTNGDLPTGTAPAVFFSGNASNFATNKGTGGNFTVNGILTDATASPSD